MGEYTFAPDRMAEYMAACGEVWTDVVTPRIMGLGHRSDPTLLEPNRLLDLGYLLGLSDIELDATVPNGLVVTNPIIPDFDAWRRTIAGAVVDNASRGTLNRLRAFIDLLSLNMRLYPLFSNDGLRFTRFDMISEGYTQTKRHDLVIDLIRDLSVNPDLMLDRHVWNYLHANIERIRPLSSPIAYFFRVTFQIDAAMGTATQTDPNRGFTYRRTDAWQYDALGRDIPWRMDSIYNGTLIRADQNPVWLAEENPDQPHKVIGRVGSANTPVNDQTASIGAIRFEAPIYQEVVENGHYAYTMILDPDLELLDEKALYQFAIYNPDGRPIFFGHFPGVEKSKGHALELRVVLPRTP